MPSIQVVEPTLDGYSGHCHSLISSLCQALAALPVDLWGGTGAQQMNFGSNVAVHPVFRRRLRLLQAFLLYRNLLRGDAPIVVTTARRSDLLLFDLSARGQIASRRVFLYFHWFRETPARLASLRKLAMRQPRIVILGTTPGVVDVFRRCGFSQAFLLPYPSPPATVGGDPLPFGRLLYAGAARQDKGFTLIVDLVELLARERAQTPITVQISADHFDKYDSQTRSDIARLRATGYAPLTLISRSLTPQQYQALFPGSICLQPYDRQQFRDRVSGVTLDAFAHGCPIIATAGTWSARMIRQFGSGIELHDRSASGLLEAARSIERRYHAFQAAARLAGQSQNPESWASLLELLPGHGTQ